MFPVLEASLTLVILSVTVGAVPQRLRPQCRSNVCDDRPVCPRVSCNCLFASRMDCSIYYQCVNGKPYQYRCSPGLLFNVDTLSCDYSYNVNCSFASTTSTTSQSTTNEVTKELSTTETTLKSTIPQTTKLLTSTETTKDRAITETTPERATTQTTRESTTEIPFESTTKKSTEASTMTESTEETTTKQTAKDYTTTEVPTTTETTEEPTTTETTEEATTSKITQEPTTTETTEKPSATETTKEHTTTEITDAPTTTEITDAPTMTEITDAPTTTETPEKHTTPEITKEPTTTESTEVLTTTQKILSTTTKITTRPTTAEATKEPKTDKTTELSTTLETNEPSTSEKEQESTTTQSTNEPTRTAEYSTNNVTEPTRITETKAPTTTIMTEFTTNITTTTSSSSSDFLCPTRFGLFSDPKSCFRFYHCSHWTPYHKWCPSGLHFNPRLKVCDWPYRAGCDIHLPTLEPQTPTAQNPNDTLSTCDCDCCELPDPSDCNAYVLCINKVAFKMRCSTGLYFNPMTGTCDFRENVVCATEDFKCPESSGRYLLPGSCSYFIECHRGKKSVRKCPEGLQFNQSSEMCSWLGSCSANQPESDSSPKTVTNNTICNRCDYCFKPVGEDCSHYVKCVQNTATVERCSDGLFFNPESEMCDHDYNVQCPEPQPQPMCPETFGYFPYPGECGLYLQCINGSATVKSCPGILHFDPVKKHCDYPWIAGCNDPDSIPTPNSTPNIIECDCECCLKPLGADCRSFVLCVNKVGFVGSCSSGLRFNSQTENCDFAENVECPITPEIPGYSCPEHQGLFPHPDDCHKFIHCAHGFPYVKDCPANLHFNPKLKVCDWPYSAGCQDSQTTDEPADDNGINCDICDSCFIPDKTDCASYTYCRDGKGHRLRCTENLSFNPEIEACDLASNVKCPNKPPPQCAKPDGLFPAKNCSKFIHCSNGIAYLKDCPDRLQFNPQMLVCDWPENVKCGDTPVQPTPQEPDNDASNFTCDCDCCFLPQKSDCSKYILCLDGYAHEGQCSRGLLFNPSLQNCDLAERVTCGEGSPLCPEPNGLFPNSDQCSAYIKCSGGVPNVEYCQNGTHFCVESKQCLDPCKAKCDANYDCSTAAENFTTTPVPSVCLSPNGYYPVTNDCSSYFVCSNGRPQRIMCPNGLHYNADYEVCEDPCDAECDKSLECKSSSGTTPKTTSSSTPSTSTADPHCLQGDGLYPVPDDCSSFYQCSKGRAFQVKCPSGLHFSTTHQTCEYPCEAKCNSSIDCSTPGTSTETPISSTPTASTLDPMCMQGDGLYPSKNDCSSFYQCSQGKAYLIKCPSGLHFSSKDQVCEYPCEAKCNGTIDCSTTPRPTSTTSPHCIAGEGLYPVPDDCTSFHLCSDGKEYLIPCPQGLHFSEEHEICEDPCVAQCNASINCETSTKLPTTSTPMSTECIEPDGLFPNSNDCGSFYQCSNGRSHLINCPSGLHFSSSDAACERPCVAGCNKSIDCSTTLKPASTPAPHCAAADGLYPVSNDCSAFYLCSNGKDYLIACPPGLHFSEKHEICENPCVALCNASLSCGTSTKPVPSSTTPHPTSPECKEPDGLFSNPDDCGSFYQCSNGRSHMIYCPSGLHFSPDDAACERPCVAGCDIDIVCPPEYPDTKGNCSCDGCYLPDPSDCSAYYFCDNGRLAKGYCPYGTLFSKVTSVCEDESTVDCEANGDPSMCPERFGFFPYPGDCKKFVHCDNGVAHVKECAGDLEYDPHSRVCTKPKGYCGDVVSDPNCPEPTGMFPDPTDCSFFYQCEHGVAHHKKCSPPLLFNPDREVCDWPENVACGKSTTERATAAITPNYTSPSPTPSDQTPSTAPCHEVPGVICPCACRVPTYDECSSYFQCREDGTACKRFCPDGLYFNKIEMVCDLPENVECRDFFFSSIRRARLLHHRSSFSRAIYR